MTVQQPCVVLQIHAVIFGRALTHFDGIDAIGCAVLRSGVGGRLRGILCIVSLSTCHLLARCERTGNFDVKSREMELKEVRPE